MAPIENQPCALLSNEENSQVFKLLGNRCQSLCTTVVQLYQTQPPYHTQWQKKYTGVLCFIKDNVKKNFFFRLFCLKRNMTLWEHEMYNNMEYIEGTQFFHMFEAQECLIAFNFANEDEANDFRIIVQQKVQARKRREDKRNRVIITQSQTLPPPTTNINYAGPKKSDLSAKQAKRKRNITKADIGIPKDFKHISHVGWNSTSGFDIDTDDETLKAFFKKAGVSERLLQRRDARDFIYDFINKHGGQEAVKQSIENNVAPPAVPPRGPTRTHLRNAPPPPIPSKSNNINATSVPNSRPKSSEAPLKKPAPTPAPNVAPPAAPPPPPPPPPPASLGEGFASPPPPPAPPMWENSPRTDGAAVNSALLESIRNGTTLRPVDDRKPLPPVDNARGNLLSEIRKGCKLKPVDDREVKPSPAPVRGNDLASALAKALEQRNLVLHSEDDDDKSDDSSDLDEWDD